MAYLILWRHLHDEMIDVEEFKDIFRGKTEEGLLESTRELYKIDRQENLPQTYKTVNVKSLDDSLKYYTERRPQGSAYQVIYKGDFKDYAELLISINVMLLLINTTYEKRHFIIEIAHGLKNRNEEMSLRFAKDLANEVYYSLK